MNTVSLEVLEQRALELFGSYKITDSQFNIGRVSSSRQRGLDIVEAASDDRYYLTLGSDRQSEQQMTIKFGTQALLGAVEVDEVTDVYEIPKGSRLLVKTLDKSPYSPAYMRTLAYRAGNFLRKIARQDPGLYGLDITAIATTERIAFDRSSLDDIVLSAVQPLSAPGAAEPQSVDQLFEKAQPYLLTEELKNAYLSGLTGDGR